MKYIMTEIPSIKLSKREQKTFDMLVMDSLCNSLFASGQITEQQLIYLINSNHNYW